MARKKKKIKISFEGVPLEKNWKQKKHEEKVFGFRNWVAKHDKNKGGSHKSKKDYDRKSLVRKLKNYLKGL